MASVEINQMLAAAVAACEDKKAEDIRILALDPTESGLTDYFLICTGTNDRQTVAITDEIELRLKHEFGTYPNSVEGRRQGEWVLMDYVDFIVHVFLPEKRAYYGLERLRPSATTLSADELNAEIKTAIRAQRQGKTAKGGTATSSNSAAESTVTGGTPVTRSSAKKARGTKSTAKSAGIAKKTAPKKTVAKKVVRKVAAKAAPRSSKTPRKVTKKHI